MRSAGLVLSTLTAFSTVATATAQTIAPEVTLLQALPVDSAGVEVAASVLPVEEGGAILAGWSTSAGHTRGFLLRVDDGGQVLWRRDLGGAGDQLLFSIAPSPERGKYMAVGMAPSPADSQRTEGWIVTFDATGLLLGNTRVGGGSVRFTSVEADGNRSVIGGQDAGTDSTVAIVYRRNPSSLLQGWKTWSGGPVTRGFAAVPAGGEHAVLVGLVGREGDEGDGFVTRLDGQGRPVWTKAFGNGPGRQLAYHVSRVAADSSLLVTGYGQTNDPARGIDGFAARYGADGAERWFATLGDSAVDRAVHGITLGDGSSVVVGYSRPQGASDDAPAWTTVLYGIDANGQRTWTRSLGGPGRESGRWIAAAPDGDLWVVGQQATATGASQVFVARLGPAARAPSR